MTERAQLLYTGDRIIAVNKPPGVSLATPRSDPSSAVRNLLASLPQKSREENGLAPDALWLAHRLDLGTSGIVLLARDPEAHGELVRLFSGRKIDKAYLALVWGHPRPWEGVLDDPVGPDLGDRRRMRIDSGGRPARSLYRTLSKAPHCSLLELKPETGRTHQLRVHLAHSGHWIVGDDLYGGPRHRGIRDERVRNALNPPHLLLHAWRIQLPETRILSALKVEAPLPGAFVETLAALNLPCPI